MNKILKLIALIVLTGCGGGGDKKESADHTPLDRRDQLRFNQYKVKGMDLYNTYCVACHQGNGEGLASLYPPLKNSDYLLEDLGRAACIMKNGQTEEITVNGTTYNQMMPGVGSLTPLEVAEILTYITNSWGNEKGLTDVKLVEKWLANCE